MLLIFTNLLSQALDAIMIMIPILIVYVLAYKQLFSITRRKSSEISANTLD